MKNNQYIAPRTSIISVNGETEVLAVLKIVNSKFANESDVLSKSSNTSFFEDTATRNYWEY